MDSKRSRKQRSDINGTQVDALLYSERGLKILAHLERSVLDGLPEESFKSDVISYYRDELSTAVSVGEIESKLPLFWSKWCPIGKNPTRWKEIYRLGLKGLPRLEHDKAEWVRKKAIELQSKYRALRRLRSASALPPTSRSTPKRPSDCLVGDLASGRAQGRRQYDGPLKQKRKRKRTASMYARSTPLKRSASPFPPATRWPSVAPEFRRCQEGTSGVEVSFQTPINPVAGKPSPTISLREYSQQLPENVAEMENGLVVSNQPSPSGTHLTDAERRHFLETMAELDDFRNQNTQLSLALDTARSEKAQLMLELDELRIQATDDTRYWKKLYRKTRKRRDSLKRRNKHMQVELVKSTTGETSKTNLTLRRENDLLREKLDSYQVTFQFQKPFSENFRAQNVEKVIDHVESARSKLFKILQGQDVLFAIEKLDGVSGLALAALFKRALGPDATTLDTSTGGLTLTDQLCTATLQAVVLSLVSAAICIWVFEAEVGALFQENDLFFSKLQDLLATQDRKLADSFLYAALEKCIDDPSVGDLTIPRRARHLSQRTLDAIRPLLDAHRHLDDQYVEVADRWGEYEQQMTEIFKQALYAKSRLILTTDLYKCVLHLPGTSCDRVSMEKRGGAETEPDAVIGITIFPGLLRYASEEGFNFNRFLTGNKTPRNVAANVLRKAVVCTR
ncbi:uncharacterized protein Z519_09731 [Cladophialophora bantiana CBS 173.52]|uniref:Uncharacterized protein n=1 Tax=Cladophialophora bantiana (strain ATCC 10958 / CBS 173.52 / CDC B-1940 / NIH 8579) TaxID=1442370 RepID=A0A0D2HFN6_CLAB1|nr:uncharacterized protein Z519_09731 [Cladophialophora bantiana CBS 173.52]KIW89575.1 hypothetical protein Z519_09731 [Cladophialophora bantiana CBS 173.52]